MCVCVCTIWIDVKLLWFAGGQQPIFLCCPTKLRKMRRMGSWTHEPVPAIYIYIVPPLGAYKSQLGGTYILSLLVYTVNVSCDLIYIYICFLIFSCLMVGVFCTTGTFHIRIREVVSIQVCFSCQSRQDGMSPSREPFGKELILQSDSEFTLL